MKHTLAAILCCAAFAFVPALQAQKIIFDPQGKMAEERIPKLIRVQVEYIGLSLGEMTALMADPAATKNDTALRKRLDGLIAKNKAKIVETQSVVCRPGQKATSESIREFIYPTEYEPAEIPNEVHIHNRDGDTKIPANDFATGPTPTAFETRNVGATLEVEPNLADNSQIIDLRLNPEIVYHVENMKWATWKDRHGESDIQMPVFYTLRLNTAVTVMAGHPCLLAALSPKDDKGVTDPTSKLMVFVKCDVIKVGR